ncbi:KilA-N domain-containing protein [Tannerella forsythia]|uniref:KilA-N domain-containing protein n=1 Tax=Tannerella forsythia TaxID=28112 RepID=UPI00242B6287|nr:KilA-N domain-containing protein [Tannerella forsythia]
MNKKESPAQAVNEQNAAVLQYSGSQIRFERIGGRLMVNATQMAKPFGLTPKDWLRTQQAKDLLNAATVRQKCLTADLLEVRQGGTPEKQGTWMHEDIALLFAQWLSPDFYLACNNLLKHVLSKSALEVPSKHGVSAVIHDGMPLYPYADIVRALGGSARGGTQWRRAKFPHHFVKLFGRNFITPQYADLLASYYNYRRAQLSLDFGLSDKGGAR